MFPYARDIVIFMENYAKDLNSKQAQIHVTCFQKVMSYQETLINDLIAISSCLPHLKDKLVNVNLKMFLSSHGIQKKMLLILTPVKNFVSVNVLAINTTLRTKNA